MNKRREVDKHLIEARLHLEVLLAYLRGLDNHGKKEQVKTALAAIKVVSDEYFYEDLERDQNAM